jgi:hypothetical protein
VRNKDPPEPAESAAVAAASDSKTDAEAGKKAAKKKVNPLPLLCAALELDKPDKDIQTKITLTEFDPEFKEELVALLAHHKGRKLPPAPKPRSLNDVPQHLAVNAFKDTPWVYEAELAARTRDKGYWVLNKLYKSANYLGIVSLVIVCATFIAELFVDLKPDEVDAKARQLSDDPEVRNGTKPIPSATAEPTDDDDAKRKRQKTDNSAAAAASAEADAGSAAASAADA